MMLLNCY